MSTATNKKQKPSKQRDYFARIYLTYEGSSFDSKVRSLALTYNGDEAGSGFCLTTGMRDMGFLFFTEDEAKSFEAHAKKFKWVKRIDFYLEDKD